MKMFSGFEYAMIAVANTMGLDKLLFEERIDWVKTNINDLEELAPQADKHLHTYKQAVRGLRLAQKGLPSGVPIEMDATNSFLQIMAALSGCRQSALYCNLIDGTKRYDAYQILIDALTKAMPHLELTRQDGKDLLMKSLAYGSNKVPKLIFTDTRDYATYLRVVTQLFPGVMRVRQLLLDSWDANTLYHTHTLPDGHISHVPVTVKVVGDDARMELTEVAHLNNGKNKTVTYIHEKQECTEYATPILANTTQSFDGYLVRVVQNACKAADIPYLTIHDGFGTLCNHMNIVRMSYAGGLADLADADSMTMLLTELRGKYTPFTKMSENLGDDIRKANYLLS